MSVIWRIELACGCGPYTHVTLCKHRQASQEAEELSWSLLRAHDDDFHPNPYEEGIPSDIIGEPDIRCGFPFRAVALDWFNGWFEGLSQAGFLVHRYEGLIAWEGRKQLLFNPGLTPLIEEFDPIHFAGALSA